jgi:hypothetical protein
VKKNFRVQPWGGGRGLGGPLDPPLIGWERVPDCRDYEGSEQNAAGSVAMMTSDEPKETFHALDQTKTVNNI